MTGKDIVDTFRFMSDPRGNFEDNGVVHWAKRIGGWLIPGCALLFSLAYTGYDLYTNFYAVVEHFKGENPVSDPRNKNSVDVCLPQKDRFSNNGESIYANCLLDLLETRQKFDRLTTQEHISDLIVIVIFIELIGLIKLIKFQDERAVELAVILAITSLTRNIIQPNEDQALTGILPLAAAVLFLCFAVYLLKSSNRQR